MFNKKCILFFICILYIFNCTAQECDLTIRGKVFDEASEMPLAYVNVLVQETAEGVVTDDDGNFTLENLCAIEYHLVLSHIGCDAKRIHLDLESDTTISVPLLHSPTFMHEVVIAGQRSNSHHQANLSVNRKTIEDNSNQNLSGLLENETGVHLIKNGSGISKPVIHGLYGNRLIILNNGVMQSGQQWGNDHSPEIDPFVADKITVLKGASGIEYGGGNLGSVVLVEPTRIEREPHVHGQINYIYETNGNGHSVNGRIEKFSPILAWRINGSLKKYGDRRSADYFLNNTGTQEANFALQLEKSWNDKLYIDFYTSTFNTSLGILRGSHIGNLTDLEQALDSDTPFFTEADFSYDIEAPRQAVSHHLAKGKAKYYFADDKILELMVATQLNDREEYDIRRSGRSDIPALSLKQTTLNTELKYSTDVSHFWKFKIGNQNIITDNTNNPETGILPLIPDYRSVRSGFFATLSGRNNSTLINLGLRYDHEYQNVLTISNGTPREIIKFENRFNNVSGIAGVTYNLAKRHSISANTSYAMRNPGINELYSNGLHQGVSGIEEGDLNLNIEKNLKNTLEYKWLPSANFSFNALLYHQRFQDYIFLNPQEEIRLTIRGAFPVFRYEQTDANIYGIDISTQFTISNSLLGLLKYSYLKGQDRENNIPLVFMPPNSLYGSLTYRVKQPLRLSKSLKLEETELELNNRLVLQQDNLLPGQDFVQAPPSYQLLGVKLSTNVIFSRQKIRCFLKADNLLNIQYRDYLNRQRYFADDLGRSISLGVNYKF